MLRSLLRGASQAPGLLRPRLIPPCSRVCGKYQPLKSYHHPHYPQQHVHYPPQQTVVTVSRGFGRRLADIAIGSALTVALIIGRDYYVIIETEREWEKLKAKGLELHRQMQEARLSGDNDWLRELVFDLPRKTRPVHSGVHFEEFGPLSSLPPDHELHGKEKIAPENTLIFMALDDDGILKEVHVAINMDEREIFGLSYDQLTGGDHFASSVAAELLLRLENQLAIWSSQGIIPGPDEQFPFLAVFTMREHARWFLVARGSYVPLGEGPSLPSTLWQEPGW